MAFYFYKVLIFFLCFIAKELIKKDDTVLSLRKIRKDIRNDYTAITSFKLITFLKIFLNQIKDLQCIINKQQQ